MYFDSFGEFFAMGRHGLYVWMAYGVFFLVVIWNVVSISVQRLSLVKVLRQQAAREKLRVEAEKPNPNDGDITQ